MNTRPLSSKNKMPPIASDQTNQNTVGHSRNATAVEFGFNFQHCAGIVLMLDNIKAAKSVRVEGNTEDVEITLNNGRKIYAQAKSVTDDENANNAIRNLKKALLTLNDAYKKNDADKLIYVTNSSNPFNDASTILHFSGSQSILSYNELPAVCKKKVREIAETGKYNIDLEKVFVLVFDFCGDGVNRYRIVAQKINEFLAALSLSEKGWGRKLLDHYKLVFTENASQLDRAIEISKEEFVWPIIVWLCDTDNSNSVLADFDEADVETIMSRFHGVIDDHAGNYNFITKVISEYDQYASLHPNKKSKDVTEAFIEEKREMFDSDFNLDGIEDDVSCAVVMLAVRRVLDSRRNIKRISEEVNL